MNFMANTGPSNNVVLDKDTVIEEIEQEGTYKYLGVYEGDGIQHRKECSRRV